MYIMWIQKYIAHKRNTYNIYTWFNTQRPVYNNVHILSNIRSKLKYCEIIYRVIDLLINICSIDVDAFSMRF